VQSCRALATQLCPSSSAKWVLGMIADADISDLALAEQAIQQA
jgi:hypothetical protein